MSAERGRIPSAKPTNGLYTFKPYVYRGNGRDTLTPRLYRTGPGPGKRAPKPSPDGRCRECGYVLSGLNHKTVCGP